MGLEIHKIAAPVIRRSILPELKEYMEQHTSYVYNNLNASINKKKIIDEMTPDAAAPLITRCLSAEFTNAARESMKKKKR